MNNDPFNSSPSRGFTVGSSVDAGLQAFMQGVYRMMCWGLVVTGGTAYAVANIPAIAGTVQTAGPIIMIAAIIFMMVGFRSSQMMNAPVATLHTKFFIFSVLMGLALSILFEMYTGQSMARVFFITAGTFAATSLYGYTTKNDLTGMGSFMMMGLWGIIIAGVVNLFMHSAAIYFVTSVLSVIIFTGITAWETQALRRMYRAGDKDANDRLAVAGALNLYLNFINLFQTMLQLMGNRR